MAPKSRKTFNVALPVVANTFNPTRNFDFGEDSMEVDEPQVRLKSGDGKRFILTKAQAYCSNALKRMLGSHANTSDYIHLKTVSGQMLARIVEWCEMHCKDIDIPDDTRERNRSNDGDINCDEEQIQHKEWETKFFSSMNEDQLLRLMHVSNYLDVRSLLNACCRVMARRWEVMKVDDLRKMYNLKNDFSEEEEANMLSECKKLGVEN